MKKNYIASYNFNGKNPMGLIPWNLDFLEELEDFSLNLFKKFQNNQDIESDNFINNRQDIILIFPHNRPKRYIENRLKKKAKDFDKPIILPTILTQSQFIAQCLEHWERGQVPRQKLEVLDRLSFLHEAVGLSAKNLPEHAVLKRLIQVDHDDKANLLQKDQIDAYDGLFTEQNIPNSSLSLAKFFPMAFNLDKLFEECFNQLVKVMDIEHAEGEVSPLAAALLGTLKSIHANYINLLSNNQIDPKGMKFTTSGFDSFRAANFIKFYTDNLQNPDSDNSELLNILQLDTYSNSQLSDFTNNFIPPFFKNKLIIFAGFVRLTEAEDVIFKFFWERGASFLWHSDPNLAQKKDVHYSCADHLNWLKNWKTTCTSLAKSQENDLKLHFLSAHDNHSQIELLLPKLKECIDDLLPNADISQFNHTLADDSLAIIMPSPNLLMPVLHNLPEKNINISIGYPIKRTLFTQFLEIIQTLQNNKSLNTEIKNSRPINYNYNKQDVLILLKHPYTKMLCPDLSQERELSNQAWLKLLFKLEKDLYEEHNQFNLPEFLDEKLGDYDNHDFSEDLLDFCELFFKHCVYNFENLNSLNSLGMALENLSTFWLNYDITVFENFPLDAETLVRVVENILPILKESRLAKDILPQKALFSILEQLINDERIPFEADPLSGMQILGMLESRLLKFKKIFIMDMTEDNLPGKFQQDPLLPDSLRNLLQLPNSHNAEILMAHTLYRLLAGAEEAWLFWEEGILASALQEKSVKSRFVEELLWNEERKRGQLSTSENSLITGYEIPKIKIAKKNKKAIEITEPIKIQFEKFLNKKLSASILDTYIKCPAKFFYTYLAKLQEETSIVEGDDNQELGSWFHLFLKNVYEEYLNSTYKHDEKNLQKILAKFDAETNYSNVKEFISPESYFVFKQAGKYHLKNYWEEMKDLEITPLFLEEKFTVEADDHLILKNPYGINKINLTAIFDRIDKRQVQDQEIHYILDYKTGSRQSLRYSIWENNDFWNEISAANQNEKFENNLLKIISETFSSLQLPLYLYIYGQTTQADCNAAWIFLREKNKEVPLIIEKDNFLTNLTQIKTNLFPSLLKFCLNHMLNATSFEAVINESCTYCPHKNYC